MNVAQLRRLQQAASGPLDRPKALPQPRTEDGPSFMETLGEAISEVDDAQKLADAQIEAFVAGEQENLHEVMIAMNQAKLHFQLMTEVRSRGLETYRALMNMQI